MKPGRAGWRKCRVLRAVVTNPLAAHVDVPGQALRRFFADDLVQRIVRVLRDRNANLDRPVVVGDVRSDFRFGRPVEPLAPWCSAIKIDECSSRVNGKLVVIVSIRGEFDLDVGP